MSGVGAVGGVGVGASIGLSGVGGSIAGSGMSSVATTPLNESILSGFMQKVTQSIVQSGLELKSSSVSQVHIRDFTYNLFIGIRGENGKSIWGIVKDLTELELVLYLLDLLNKKENSENQPTDLIGLLVLAKLQEDFANLTNAMSPIDFLNFLTILSGNLGAMGGSTLGSNINVFV